MRFPVQPNPFVVYYGMIPKLGLVRDDHLRNKIVSAYAKASGLVQTFRFNNQLINEAAPACHSHWVSGDYDDGARQRAENILVQYGDGIRELYHMTMTEVDELLPLLPKAS